ncbi:MAG TPA: toll/interleukin-1 receptor domain-containing protein [Ktedonobacterales bacterium]|nr:toll/interleukin-1 receptor domain-containing protein [Ktedonobacterales bacterium]
MSDLRIFLSHSHKDNIWCSAFVDELKRHGVDVWYDKRNLDLGDEWIPTIETELEGRDVFLVVLTPDSLASKWVQKEIQLALAGHKRIISIIHKSTEIKGFLRTYQMLDVIGLSSVGAAQSVAAELDLIRSEQPPSSKGLQPIDEKYEHFEITGHRSILGLFYFQITNTANGEVFYKAHPYSERIRRTSDASSGSNQKSVEELRQFAHMNRLEELSEKGAEWYSYRFRRKK